MYMTNMHPNFAGVLFCIGVVCVIQPIPATATLLRNFSYFLEETVTGKWYNAQTQRVAMFVCSTDDLEFLRNFSAAFQVRVAASPQAWKDTAKRQSEPLTYIADLACDGVNELLLQAADNGLLKIPNRWLLLNLVEPTDESATAMILHRNDSEGSGSGPCRELAAALAHSGPGFRRTTATDADVTVACAAPSAAAGRSVVLVDMWAATPLGTWSPDGFLGDRRPPAVRRLAAGLGGRQIRASLLILRNESLEHMDDGKDIKTDNLSKFNWAILNNVVDMLNGTLAILLTQRFGLNVNGTWNGVIGMLIRGEAEMTGTSVALIHSRLGLARFTAFSMPVNGIFIFRAPPLSYEHNLFTLPFPSALWLASIGIVVLCAVLLYGTLKVEGMATAEEHSNVWVAPRETPHQIVSEQRKRELKASWSDVVLLAIGAVCQQGSQVEARGVTGRMITVLLFIGILFLYTSYTASIVALLQSTSTSIKTYKDLLHNKIPLGVENKEYNIVYMRSTDDPIRRAIYDKKMKKNLLTMEEGVRRMRTSYFAFQGMQALMYAEIADTFEENEKCGLVFLDKFHTIFDPMIAISNWSENYELILIALRKNYERGIRNRQIHRYLTHKPMCVNKGGSFQSVALIDCEAVFVVLGVGYGLSLLFFLIEHTLFRCKKTSSILNARASILNARASILNPQAIPHI